ncbi:MAG: LolA family protein [Acetobacteraceae bacterium]
MRRRDLLLALPASALAVLPGVRSAAAAQKPTPAPLTSAERQAVAQIAAYLNGLTSLKAKFLQIAPDGAVSQGLAWMERPGRMRFQYDPPSPYLLVAGHGLLVFHDSQLNQTTNVLLSSTPLGILLAPHVELTGSVTVTAFQRLPGEIDLTLVRTASPAAGSLTLVFSTDLLRLRQWAIRDAEDKVTRVTLYDVELGGHFPDHLFTYVPPPGIGTRGRGG